MADRWVPMARSASMPSRAPFAHETADGGFVNDSPSNGAAGVGRLGQAADKVTVQATPLTGKREQPCPAASRSPGVNLRSERSRVRANWSAAGSTASPRREHERAAHLDGSRRTAPPTFVDKADIADLQLQHAWRPSPAHALVGRAYSTPSTT